MNLRAIALALALAACGQTAEKQNDVPTSPAGPDPFDLNIEIGRYGAMLSQVSGQTETRPGSAEPEVTAPRELARRLRETVWEYNIERSKICAKGLFTEITCTPAYEPVWIAEPPGAEPTLEEIQTRSDAVGREVMTLWNAICEDARTRATTEEDRAAACAME
ncbi:MAG: hypothetical protein AB7T59_08205 [Hyphomonadaceae bacterium]